MFDSVVFKVLVVFLFETDIFGLSGFNFRRYWLAKFIVLVKVKGVYLNALHHFGQIMACFKEFSLM